MGRLRLRCVAVALGAVLGVGSGCSGGKAVPGPEQWAEENGCEIDTDCEPGWVCSEEGTCLEVKDAGPDDGAPGQGDVAGPLEDTGAPPPLGGPDSGQVGGEADGGVLPGDAGSQDSAVQEAGAGDTGGVGNADVTEPFGDAEPPPKDGGGPLPPQGCEEDGDCAPGEVCGPDGECIPPVGQACEDDGREENDAPEAASPVEEGVLSGLRLCGADPDFFGILLAAGDVLRVAADFDAETGDLDLEVLAPDGRLLGFSAGVTGHEEVTVEAAGEGMHLVRVFLYEGEEQEVTYDLTVEVRPAAPSCVDDPFEDNDTPEAPVRIEPGTFDGLEVCPGDPDFFGVELGAGDRLSVAIEFVQAEGDLDLVVLDPSLEEVGVSAGVEDGERVAVVAGVAGRFVIGVTGYLGATNTYTLDVAVETRVCPDDALEANDAAEAAVPVEPGVYEALRICPGNEDYYAVDLEAGEGLAVGLTAPGAAGALDLVLIGPGGEVLARSEGAGDAEAVAIQAARAGRHLIRVRGTSADVEATYRMTVEVTPAVPPCRDDGYEDNDEPAAAAALRPGTYRNLAVCGGDEDYYAVPARRGDQVRAVARFRHVDGDVDVQLLGPDGTVLAASAGVGDVEEVSAVVPADGNYVVRVYGFAGAQNSYELTVEVAHVCRDDAFEENDTAQTARPMAAGSYPGLQVCSGDDDFYSVNVPAGDLLRVVLRFVHAAGDVDLQVLGPDGRVLGVSAGVSDSETLEVQAVQAGTHVIRVYGFAGAENSYEMTVEVVHVCRDDAFEDNDGSGTARAVPPGHYDLAICRGDEDFFAFNLGPGDRITVRLAFVHARGDVDMFLFGPDGRQVAASTGVGDTEEIRYEARVAGRYVLRVIGFAGAENSYSMDVAVVAASPCGAVEDWFEDNDRRDAATPVRPGFYPDLYVCSGDDDWYTLPVLQGQTVVFGIDFLHRNGDVDMELYDVAGNLVASSTGVGDHEEVGGQALVDTRAYVRVYGWAGARNQYDMTVDLW